MASPFKVTGIDHVVFHVKDLARSRKFYVDFLGMEVDHERSWQCFLKCGNQGVALFEARDGAEVHGGSEVNHMALQLAAGDYQRVKSILENAGIEVHGRPGDAHCIYFHDPDGHQLQLLTPGEH
ncbi:MAG TPA: VOC family protein [Candidatus Binatia bacterium]|jgi:catechol 2,3-dioxygenase-like lactoylglutathione lyase family enzyme